MIKNIIANLRAKLNEVLITDMTITKITRKTKIIKKVKNVIAGGLICSSLAIIGYQQYVIQVKKDIIHSAYGTIGSYEEKRKLHEKMIDILCDDIFVLENHDSDYAKRQQAEIDNLCKDLWTTTTAIEGGK